MIEKTEITEEADLEDEVRRFQTGDKKAFDKLVLRYKDAIFNLCFRITGDYDEANDCAQESFIKVYKNIKGFQFKSSFSTWLYRIAINTCKNHVSSLSYRMKQKMIRLGNPGHEYSDAGEIDIGDSSSDPVKVYEKKENEILIQKAIKSLPAHARALIVLRDIEGKSYEEIAKITGLKHGTVKSQLARARQKLRGKLRGVL